MKILFVVPSYGPTDRGGIATFYRNLFPAMLRSGCKIDVCSVWGDEVEPDQTGLTNIFVDRALVAREEKRLAHLAATPFLRHVLARSFAAWETCDRGNGYDVVEVPDWNMLYAPWLAASNGPKVVVQLHSSSGQTDFYDA